MSKKTTSTPSPLIAESDLSEKIKENPDSVLNNISQDLSALERAYQVQKTVSDIGFDWPNVHGVIDKIAEEVEEVRDELTHSEPSIARIADELGDLYFALTNLVRHLQLNPEQVLQQANQKFERRFRVVEQLTNTPLHQLDIVELEQLWQQAKNQVS